MEWFRMYSEFANDPKVQSMNEAMQRRLLMLLCLRCSNALVTLQDDEIAFALRISDAELEETKSLFVRKGFISKPWEIANWNKRQFVSDSSASRVAKFRAKAKDEAIKELKQGCNVTVTPQNRTDTDTDTEQNREDKSEQTEAPQAVPPRKASIITLATYLTNCKQEGVRPINESDPIFAYAESIGLSREFLLLAWDQFKDRYMENGKRQKDWPMTFRNAVKGNWFKLWFLSNDGGYALTTVGQQAKRANEVHS